jgi:hypothetical protein
MNLEGLSSSKQNLFAIADTIIDLSLLLLVAPYILRLSAMALRKAWFPE